MRIATKRPHQTRDHLVEGFPNEKVTRCCLNARVYKHGNHVMVYCRKKHKLAVNQRYPKDGRHPVMLSRVLHHPTQIPAVCVGCKDFDGDIAIKGG